jgi:hypothetical protein
MDLGLSIGIGLVILGIGLYSRKWAALVSIFAFFPFWLAGITGILGIKIDPGAAGQAVSLLSGKILVTYLVGVGLGWLPHFIKNKMAEKGGKQ